MSNELKQRFDVAATDAKSLPQRPSNDDLLELYALYKQGSEGDVSGSRPGLLDFVGGAKYDAWSKISGMSNLEAMQRYVEKVTELKG
ncbi:MAG: acyl-CoA-binding protein [Gammaproteobacteria bacterium]